jgi:hypothetical protein
MHAAFELRKSEGMRSLGNSYTCDDNIKTNLTEIDCENLDMVNLMYDRDHVWIFVNTVLKVWVSLKVWNG